MAKVAELEAYRKPLSVKEEAFLHAHIVLRMPMTAAARHAGMSGTSGSEVVARPHVALAARELRSQIAESMKMTREKIQEGLLEAIDIARTMSEPMTMVASWREIAKMTGFDKPENTGGQLTPKQERFLQLIQELPEEQLLEMCAKDVNYIDAEVTETAKDS